MTYEDVAPVNGVDLFVRTFGEPSLPLLIVIHGGPTWDHSYLLPAVSELSDVAHVVVYDLRGCGRSSRTPSLPVSALQPDYLADDVAALVGHFGTAQADVLGFSYGGMIAMRVAEQHPSVLRSVILASTTAYREFPPSPDLAERERLCTDIEFDDPVLTAPSAPDGALSRAMAVGSAPMNIWQLARLDSYLKILDGVRFSSDWNEPFMSGTLRPAAPDDAAQVLRSWGGPVLLLQGERDMAFPISVARRLHAEVKGSTLVSVPDAAHMAHIDNPGVWVGAVRDFLVGSRAGGRRETDSDR